MGGARCGGGANVGGVEFRVGVGPGALLPHLPHCLDSLRGPCLHAAGVLPTHQQASASCPQAEPYSHGEYQAPALTLPPSCLSLSLVFLEGLFSQLLNWGLG